MQYDDSFFDGNGFPPYPTSPQEGLRLVLDGLRLDSVQALACLAGATLEDNGGALALLYADATRSGVFNIHLDRSDAPARAVSAIESLWRFAA